MNKGLRSLILGAAVLVAAATGGCRGDTLSLVEVTGTVSYQGNPVANANVTFQPREGPPAMGVSDEQGHFSLATRGRPGAVAGPTTVAIMAYEEIEAIPPGEEHPEGYSEVRSLIPEKYSLVSSSPLQVEVLESEANHFDLELED